MSLNVRSLTLLQYMGFPLMMKPFQLQRRLEQTIIYFDFYTVL